jgi:hypothetical protein
MGVGAPEEGHMQKAGEVDVVDEEGLAGQEARILVALDAGA